METKAIETAVVCAEGAALAAPAALPAEVREFIRASKAENTLRAYSSDWRDFCAWCEVHGVAEDELPAEFFDRKAILITSAQKLFNGLTKFGLGPRSLGVGAVLMDDSHACIDAIRQNTRIALPKKHPAYRELLTLLGAELEKQGVGTWADIKQGSYNALLPVPYWDWWAKHTDVANILAKHTDTKEVKFSWPLIRDALRDCLCVVSGDSLEIATYLPPLHLFGSYENAKYRIFMSATVTNDSFLIKGLGLTEEVITKPLTYDAEKWSGEKMILVPSLIDRSLKRETVVEKYAPPKAKRNIGVVGLVPSFRNTADWQRYGAAIVKKENIDKTVQALIGGDRERTIVFANRYDGIDLPDDACRILLFDSLPFAEELFDRYLEGCRSESIVTKTKLARIVE